jgi:hypothetical protein
MMRSMLRRASFAAVMALALLSPFASSVAQAASLPVDADVRVGRCIEPASFRWLVASRYHVEFNKVIAADIDSDGDIDVVATTDHSFTVWVNDGAGHLTSQRPTERPAIASQAPATTFSQDDDRAQPSSNDGVPGTALPAEKAHAPPTLAIRKSARRNVFIRTFDRNSLSAPRAPPLSSP